MPAAEKLVAHSLACVINNVLKYLARGNVCAKILLFLYRVQRLSQPRGGKGDKLPLPKKMSLMARVSNKPRQLNPAPSLFVWLRYKHGEPAFTDRRRGEGRSSGALKPVLWVSGAHQSDLKPRCLAAIPIHGKGFGSKH